MDKKDHRRDHERTGSTWLAVAEPFRKKWRRLRGLGIFLLLPIPTQGDGQVLLDRFGKLDEPKQRIVIEQIETEIDALDLPLSELVRGLLEHPEAPEHPPSYREVRTWFDEKKYAPGLPIKRKVLPENHPFLARGRKKFLKQKVYYNLRTEYGYHLGKNKIFQLSKERDPRDRLRQYLLGYPPRADLAREVFLKIFDTNSDWDQHATYFDHTYTDRKGNVYLGITLFDVWNSGQQLECPDVDVIPFAWEILGQKYWKSPIPAGKRRTGLYHDIGISFRDYRRYRIMLEGVASYYFASDPPVSPFVEVVKNEIHFMIAMLDSDLSEVARFVEGHKSVSELNISIADLYKSSDARYEDVIATRRRLLDEDHQKIRDAAIDVLERELIEKG